MIWKEEMAMDPGVRLSSNNFSACPCIMYIIMIWKEEMATDPEKILGFGRPQEMAFSLFPLFSRLYLQGRGADADWQAYGGSRPPLDLGL